MSFFRAFIVRVIICPVILVFFTPCASFPAKGVKTSLKKYSLFTYNNRVYLCEPYLVQKNEWLYKILRRKGEISASDFPLFLNIFKTINPKIGNIDAIEPGSRILIPLKQVDENTYNQDNNGSVEVPVLAFSAEISPDAVSRHTHTHEVLAGDTISGLLPKEFLTPGGNPSNIGKKTVLQLNPDIKNINCIYQGASIIIPDPSILSQPWFKDLLGLSADHAAAFQTIPSGEIEKEQTPVHTPKPLSGADMAHLKRYAQLVRGHLMHQGKLCFPPAGQTGNPECLDLSKHPVINENPKESNGKKTILLGPDTSEDAMGPDLVAAMKAYWKNLEFKKLSDVLNTKRVFKTPAMTDIPESHESLIKTLVAATPCSYEPQIPIRVSLGTVQLTVSLGRVTHEHAQDLLINSESVYGKALEALTNQGYQILDLPLDATFEDICIRLFSHLGYQTWKDPSFNAGQKVENIPGVYAQNGTEKLFLTRTPLFDSAAAFLKNENITVIML